MNKLLGDVSDSDRKIAEQLVEFEPQIDRGEFPIEKKAQMYVCMAHDWYQLGLEEEGNRLILKAEQTCPGYFKNTMLKQTVGDESFDFLVKSLTRELVSLLIYHINEMRNGK